MKTVSVIIPIYNVALYLNQCLTSVCNQSYKNIEIILIDDGSTDNSARICEEWALKDNRITVFHKCNGGLSSARNAGLDIATGDYISFIDSDDIVPDNFIEVLLSILEKDKSDLAVCKIERFDDRTNAFIDVFYPFTDGVYSSNEYLSLILQHRVDNASWNKLYKREAINNIRFKEGIINEDFPFVTRVLSRDISISYTNKTKYLYRKREGSITQSVKPNIFDFVSNAIELEAKISPELRIHAKGHLYYETVNCIACIIESSNSKELSGIVDRCNDIIKANIGNFILNPYCNKQKLKYVLTKFPTVYKFIYNLLKK